MCVGVCVCAQGKHWIATRQEIKEGKESEKEIQPQLFPLGLVAMATEAFSAECQTNIKKSERDAHREAERDNMAAVIHCHCTSVNVDVM